MPRPIDIRCEVDENGHLPRKMRVLLGGQLKLYAGREVRIQVSSPKRSSKANAFYWVGVIGEIQRRAAEAGHAVSAQALHEYFKAKYLQPSIEYVWGEEVLVPASTAKLDSTAFHEYIESIRMDEAVIQLGVYFDEPEGLRSYSIEDLPY